MKITHRYNLGFPLSINAKCGESAGAFISGMFGLGSTMATNDTNEAIAEKQIQMQKEENQKNRDYNTAEAEKTRQFSAGQADIQRQYNTQERLAQQQYQTEQWNQQFERSNRDAYALQVEGARDAGLNPQVLFGNGTSAAGTSSVGAPSGSGGTTAASGPMASYNNGLSPVPFQAISPALAFQQIAQGFSSLASAKKSGADVDKIYQEIDNLQIEAKYKQLLTQGIKITNKLAGVKLKYAEKREIQELAKLTEDTVLSVAQGKSVSNQADLFKAQENVQNILADKTGQEYELLKLDVATYMQRLNSLLKLQGAQANESTQNAIAVQFENNIKNASNRQDILNAVEKAKQQKLINDAQAAEVIRYLDTYKLARSSSFGRLADDVLEYIKGKISIFK